MESASPMPASVPALMPTHRRITFSLLDVAGNLLYCVITGYALYYFTNVYELSSAAAGAIVLIATCVGVLDAPMWGSVIDRTRSRLGRSRPWILRMALPFCVLTWLLFTTPPVRASGFLTSVGMTCAVRLGSGLGAMLSSVILGRIGFDGGRAAQTGMAVSGIGAAFLFLPLCMFVAAMLPMAAYRRYETVEDGIVDGLQCDRQTAQ